MSTKRKLSDISHGDVSDDSLEHFKHLVKIISGDEVDAASIDKFDSIPEEARKKECQLLQKIINDRYYEDRYGSGERYSGGEEKVENPIIKNVQKMHQSLEEKFQSFMASEFKSLSKKIKTCVNKKEKKEAVLSQDVEEEILLKDCLTIFLQSGRLKDDEDREERERENRRRQRILVKAEEWIHLLFQDVPTNIKFSQDPNDVSSDDDEEEEEKKDEKEEQVNNKNLIVQGVSYVLSAYDDASFTLPAIIDDEEEKEEKKDENGRKQVGKQVDQIVIMMVLKKDEETFETCRDPEKADYFWYVDDINNGHESKTHCTRECVLQLLATNLKHAEDFSVRLLTPEDDSGKNDVDGWTIDEFEWKERVIPVIYSNDNLESWNTDLQYNHNWHHGKISLLFEFF
jgi:hypothetical protein